MSDLDRAMKILEGMKDGGNWRLQREIYFPVLKRLPEKLVLPAVSKLCGQTWRPAPWDIVRCAAEIEMCNRAGTLSPYPSADEAYAEIMDKVRAFGLNGRQHPDRPGVYLSGAPSFSHPLVARAVVLVGGWEGLCSGEANYAEGIAKQIKGCYERQAEQYVQQAAEKLGLPPDQNRVWFPRWKPYRVAIEWKEPSPGFAVEGTPELPPPRDRPRLVPPPPEVFRALRRVGVRLDAAEGPERTGELRRIAPEIDPGKMREVERELADKASRREEERIWKRPESDA